MKVLIVDDSIVFRSQIKGALSGAASIEVVGSVSSGRIALSRLAQGGVDLVTLDCEMPEMNGIDVIREMRRQGSKARVVMFSSVTQRGAALALEALRAGADDVVAKPSAEPGSMDSGVELIRRELLPRVLQFAPRPEPEAILPRPSLAAALDPGRAVEEAPFVKVAIPTFRPSIIVIGSSTGGPPALEAVLSGLRPPLRVPILIVQHMPPVFTAHLAKRIEALTGVPTAEARDGEPLELNRIYVAPGDHHLRLSGSRGQASLRLDREPPVNSVRPAVDPLFGSAASIFGDRVMGFVLTGMGEDGCAGARAIKRAGGGIMIQDKASSVVFGMPGAVHASGAFDRMGGLEEVRATITRMVQPA